MDTGLLTLTVLLGIGIVGVAAVVMDSEQPAPVGTRRRYLEAHAKTTSTADDDGALRAHIALESARRNALIPKHDVPGHSRMQDLQAAHTARVQEHIRRFQAVDPGNFAGRFKELRAAHQISASVGLKSPELEAQIPVLFQDRHRQLQGLGIEDAAAFHESTKKCAAELGLPQDSSLIVQGDEHVFTKAITAAFASESHEDDDALQRIQDKFAILKDDDFEPTLEGYKLAHKAQFDTVARELLSIIDTHYKTDERHDQVEELYRYLKNEAAEHGYQLDNNETYDEMINGSASFVGIMQTVQEELSSRNFQLFSARQGRYMAARTYLANRQLLAERVRGTETWQAYESMYVQLTRIDEFMLLQPNERHLKILHAHAFECMYRKLAEGTVLFDNYLAVAASATTELQKEAEAIQASADKVAPMTTLLVRTGGDKLLPIDANAHSARTDAVNKFITHIPADTLLNINQAWGKVKETLNGVLADVYKQLEPEWTSIRTEYASLVDGSARREIKERLPHKYAAFRRKLPHLTLKDSDFENHGAVSKYAIHELRAKCRGDPKKLSQEFMHDWPDIPDPARAAAARTAWREVGDDPDKFVAFVHEHAYPGIRDVQEYSLFELKQYKAFEQVYRLHWDKVRDRTLPDVLYDAGCTAMHFPEAYLPGYMDAVSDNARRAADALKSALATASPAWADRLQEVERAPDVIRIAVLRSLDEPSAWRVDMLRNLKGVRDNCDADPDHAAARPDFDIARRTDMYSTFADRREKVGIDAAYFAAVDLTDQKNWIQTVATAANDAAIPNDMKVAQFRRLMLCMRGQRRVLSEPTDPNDQMTALSTAVEPDLRRDWDLVMHSPHAAGEAETERERQLLKFAEKWSVYAAPSADADAILQRLTDKRQKSINIAESTGSDYGVVVPMLSRHLDLYSAAVCNHLRRYKWSDTTTFDDLQAVDVLTRVRDPGTHMIDPDDFKYTDRSQPGRGRTDLDALKYAAVRAASESRPVAEKNALCRRLAVDHAIVFSDGLPR